ncbi:MAG: peptidase dipeptidylpeptidase domain protein [Candidatus Aminicenantes bacterium]|nr:peptidase dipeptidylpeptidase domain protein [Candidatus Aminicenantes bacterium]
MNVRLFSGRLGQVSSRLFLFLALFILALPSGRLGAQDNRITKANYESAAKFAPGKIDKMIFDLSVEPRWLEKSDRFWYGFKTSKGRIFYLVDPLRKSKQPVFDNVKMAARLTELSRFPYDPEHLPIETIKFIKNDQFVQFKVDPPYETGPPAKEEEAKAGDEKKEPKKKALFFEYELATGKLIRLENFEEPPQKPVWASVSPDEKTVVFARNHNLYLMDAVNYQKALKDPEAKDVVETQLTTDGEDNFSFAVRGWGEHNENNIEKIKNKDKRKATGVVWSQDSKKFAVVREDSRKVNDLWVINSVAEPRPTLETYKYAMPGEPDVPQFEILVFDRETRSRVKVKAENFKDQQVNIMTARAQARLRYEERASMPWLAETSDKLYFARISRDMTKLDLCVADTATGDVRVLVEERSNTYITYMFYAYWQPPVLLGNGRELIIWSERDGWSHYYLYDGDGKLKNPITAGPFSCRTIEAVDERNRVLYFTACGREKNEDPYYQHLYRINLDGTGLKLLSPENANHSIVVADSRLSFIDNFSRVDTTPKSVLRDALGNVILDLETADLSVLLASGYQFAEPFQVKADDGITDLYGVMWKPFDLDPAKKYPVILWVYPGPQTEEVAKSFPFVKANMADSYSILFSYKNTGLAQFGFVVLEVGNRGGSPERSKWYQNYGYGNLRDYGLADKKAAVEQLASRFPYIDSRRVGIFGHSGGGFMSTAAMLVYPDFFKAAVSVSGNHDNNVYNYMWSETHHGVKEVVDKDGKTTFEYTIDKNSEIAKNLKGHLLLVTGDVDSNVHPAGTLRVADALIKANKRFDFFILPGIGHSYPTMFPYLYWLAGDYFCRHLIGDADTSVDIIPLNQEREQSGEKKLNRNP